MWIKVYEFLTDKGYDVYSSGAHEGICQSPYLVVYEGDTKGLNGNVVGRTMLDVMIVNPMSEHSKLEVRVKELKEYLKELDFIKLTGFVSGTIIQAEKKAHSKVIECVNNRRL